MRSVIAAGAALWFGAFASASYLHFAHRRAPEPELIRGKLPAPAAEPSPEIVYAPKRPDRPDEPVRFRSAAARAAGGREAGRSSPSAPPAAPLFNDFSVPALPRVMLAPPAGSESGVVRPETAVAASRWDGAARKREGVRPAEVHRGSRDETSPAAQASQASAAAPAPAALPAPAAPKTGDGTLVHRPSRTGPPVAAPDPAAPVPASSGDGAASTAGGKMANASTDAGEPPAAAAASGSRAASVQCRGFKKNGERCGRKTRDPSGYCYQHRPK